MSAEELNERIKGARIVDGRLQLDLAENGFIEWTDFGYRYTGRVLQEIGFERGCIADPDATTEVECSDALNSPCCENQVLREDANCKLWAPPTGCLKSASGGFTGAVSIDQPDRISPGSTYTAESPQLCIPVPDTCYKVQSMAYVCADISVQFCKQQTSEGEDEPTAQWPKSRPDRCRYSVAGNVFCADFPYEGQDEPISGGFVWAWSQPDTVADTGYLHQFNVAGCCSTGVLCPGENWEPTFKIEVTNGQNTNTDIAVIGWRISYCIDMLAMPPCAQFTEIEDERQFRSIQVN